MDEQTMKKKTIDGISPNVFAEICLTLWRDGGSPLLLGMAEIIMEEYNNEAIEVVEQWDRRWERLPEASQKRINP